MPVEDYFIDKCILHYVFKWRASVAKSRNRKQLIYEVSGNIHVLKHVYGASDAETEAEIALLSALLPPRRQWKKLPPQHRRKPSGEPISSYDKTVRMLRHTCDWYRRHQPDAPFLSRQTDFCNEVRAFIGPNSPDLPHPRIIAVRKSPDSTVCRPIAIYPPAARFAICLVNRYLSQRFDPYFEDSSFAFRTTSAKLQSCIGGGRITHHNAVARVREYRTNRPGKLWVAECDIQKFFDTVNHSVVRKLFFGLVNRIEKGEPNNPIGIAAIKLFLSYLNSYTFMKEVISKNEGGYFSGKMSQCKFGWVEDDLIKSGIYKSPRRARLGVPQGGALSGLIANILLDRADKTIRKCACPDLFYARYCDDMILIHKKRNACSSAFDSYQTEIRKLKLLCHGPQKIINYDKEFWKEKSKAPYCWVENKVKWIGFLGYEINCEGSLRVRKSSLDKELLKQYKTVQEVLWTVPSCSMAATPNAHFPPGSAPSHTHLFLIKSPNAPPNFSGSRLFQRFQR